MVANVSTIHRTTSPKDKVGSTGVDKEMGGMGEEEGGSSGRGERAPVVGFTFGGAGRGRQPSTKSREVGVHEEDEQETY